MTTKSILLIDSEVGIREVLSHCLRDFGGWEVIAAASISEGVAKLTVKSPDAIILDVQIPSEANGLQFLQALKRSSWQYIPVVLITAQAKWLTPQQLQEIGVVGAIAKPFNPISLPLQIANLLGW
jgi:CheY-like chemotaxis protein